MISSQDGTDARRDRPPAALRAGRSRAVRSRAWSPRSSAAAAVSRSAALRSASASLEPCPPWRDRRHGRRRGSVRGNGDIGKLVRGQAQPGGHIVVWCDVPAARIENPLGDLRPAGRGERDLHLPVAVGPLPRVPPGVVGGRAQLGEPLGHDVTEPWPRPRVPGAANRGPLCLLGTVLALGEDGALEAAYPLDRESRRVSDLVGRLSGTDAVLDLLGSQGTLHFDLVLSEPGELAASHGPQAVIEGQHETPAPPRHIEDGVTAVLADCDEAQLVHWRPFRAARPRGGVARTYPRTSLTVGSRPGQHLARHVPHEHVLFVSWPLVARGRHALAAY